MSFQKTEQINGLLDIYEPLLTTKQQEVMNMYYRYDLSLSEIAEQAQVSRTAVFDLIKRTTALLLKYEERLMFYQKKQQLLQCFKDNVEVENKIKEIF